MSNNLYAAHIKSLLDRAIDPTAANANQLRSVSSTQASQNLGAPAFGDAIEIPYLDLAGAAVLGDDNVPFARVRVFDSRTPNEMLGNKPQRYMARPGAGFRLYTPMGLAQLSLDAFLILTEGEFKAIAGTAAGIPTASIPGVTTWGADAGVLSDETPVHPHILETLRQLNPAGIMVLADSDAKTNDNVKNALSHLAAALTKQLRIPALYARVPDAKPLDDTAKAKRDAAAKKLGLDDWIACEGATNVHKYLNWLWTKMIERERVLASGGYFALGYQGEFNYVWSIARGCMMTFSGNDTTSPARLMNLAGGGSWCEAKYGEMSKSGKVTTDFQKMGGDLIEACIQAGPFSPEMCRGTGVWKDGNALVVSGGDTLWRSDGAAQDRFGSGYTYPRSRPLGIASDIEPASATQAMELLECLSTWGFRDPSETLQVFGWINLAYLTGALPWRPHASLTAPRGSGKSQLQRLVKNLLGHAAIACDADSTAPGIRQALRQDSLALLLDEAESSGKKLQATMDMLRSASSGAEVLRGTQDQSGTSFALRTMALVTGIVPPTFNAADESRFVRVELDPLSKESQTTMHRLLKDDVAATELGLALFARMIRSWGRLLNAETLIRVHMSGDGRFKDTFAPILAAAWVALNDGEITDEAAQVFVGEMRLGNQQARVCAADDDADVVATMLGKVIKVQVADRNLETTIADLVSNAAYELRTRNTKVTGPFNKALGLYGMRVILDNGGSLLVNVKSENFKRLFETSKALAGADLKVPMSRNSLVEPKMSQTINVGGVLTRCFVVRIKDFLAANDDQFEPKLLTANDLG